MKNIRFKLRGIRVNSRATRSFRDLCGLRALGTTKHRPLFRQAAFATASTCFCSVILACIFWIWANCSFITNCASARSMLKIEKRFASAAIDPIGSPSNSSALTRSALITSNFRLKSARQRSWFSMTLCALVRSWAIVSNKVWRASRNRARRSACRVCARALIDSPMSR